MVERVDGPNMVTVRWTHDGIVECYTTGVVAARERPDPSFACPIPSAAQPAVVITEEVFGAVGGHAGEQAAWPIMHLAGGLCTDGVAGRRMVAISGDAVQPVRLDGRPVGFTYADAHAQWCRLSDIRSDASLPWKDQAEDVFFRMERALATAGMVFGDTVRTWFYLNNMLAWYDTFNRVRTTFFNQRRVFDGLVPASTGIGSPNSAGTALVAGALAVRPKDGAVRAREVPSPMQCSATRYGSSFSRAVEITGPLWRRLLISGTAAIAPDGTSMYPGDVRRQVDLVLDAVGAILESRGMAWSNTVQAVAYIRNRADVSVLDEECRRHAIPALPAILFESVICRRELLFELEVDAIAG